MSEPVLEKSQSTPHSEQVRRKMAVRRKTPLLENICGNLAVQNDHSLDEVTFMAEKCRNNRLSAQDIMAMIDDAVPIFYSNEFF